MLHKMLGRQPVVLIHRHWPIRNLSQHSTVSDTSTSSTSELEIAPPFKRYRESTSVLRALSSCVKDTPGSFDPSLGPDPYLCAPFRRQNCLLAKNRGRLTAQYAIKEYLANDIVALSSELPRIDRFVPLQPPDSVLTSVSNGSISAQDAMHKLLLLLAPKPAWKLYTELAPTETWDSDTLHRLLDLLCSTNSTCASIDLAQSANFDLTCLPDPTEYFYHQDINHQVGFRAKKPIDSSGALAAEKELEIGDPTDDCDDFDGQAVSSDEVSVEDVKSEQAESMLNRTWLINGPAEQLFSRENSVLSTPRGWQSMIRGAAKFENAERALELFHQFYSESPPQEAFLDAATFDALLRCLHRLPGVRDGKEDVWPHIRLVLEKMASQRTKIGTWAFSSALHSLSEALFAYSTAGPTEVRDECGLEYPRIALGLLVNLNHLGLEPSLGVMANLLKLLHVPTFHSSNLRSRCGRIGTHDCTHLLRHFLDDLKQRFTDECPSRTDELHYDDNAFFTNAMQIARRQSNVDLASKLFDLLVGQYTDLRFLLRDSVSERKFVEEYTSLLLDALKQPLKYSPLRIIHLLEELYVHFRSIIIASNRVSYKLEIQFLHMFEMDSMTSSLSPETLHKLRLSCYRLMSDFFFELCVLLRPKLFNCVGLSVAVEFLFRHADLDPRQSLANSSVLLGCLEKWITPSSWSPKDRISSKLQHLKPEVIEWGIRTALPEEPNLQYKASLSGGFMSKLITTMRRWLKFVVTTDLVAWNWGPDLMSFLWQMDMDISDELVLDALDSLSRSEYKPTTRSRAIAVSQMLEPILADLANCALLIESPTAPSIATARRKCLEEVAKIVAMGLTVTKDFDVELKSSPGRGADCSS